MKVAVLGLGISGRAAASFLLQKGHTVIGLDKKVGEGLNIEMPGLELACDSERYLEGVSQLVLSPGIPWSHPVVRKASAMGIEVIGEVELALRHLSNRCIGITGSNGKTTTTLLIQHVLNHQGLPSRALGNVGIGLSSYLLDPHPEEILVIEFSSFQLEALKTRCLDLAVILNITENHLDRYDSMQEYASAKIGIQYCLKEKGFLFVSQEVFKQYGRLCPLAKTFASERDLEPNFCAALSVLKEFGVTKSAFLDALTSFERPLHRIEFVVESNGVVYYNDSKASTVVSVMYAMEKMTKDVILIVGGTDKGLCYTPWIESFKGKVKHIFAYGLAADKIEKELQRAFPLTKVSPFEEAVTGALQMARCGDVVLLSPGCSSYDQFRNFEHRGCVFKQMVRTWIEKKQS